ncbi:fimbrial protein [Burkholderia ubonensis]|uniref:fimbria/pilus outer membrane usher protein n=1 Tax=Burkholderia ubonensis TaxID=101571 RepID=UPI00075CD514|nr:fimbria/pilus outer membrane usher protein [Burkholderia ubonensis]KVT41447.1 fimbrial protein [Burkholderia ubonensis]KVV35964.1 fimbrial protein [Burkholderia ubonensis]KVV39762.1 fimbrial protein [Burkholderia ubonensis]KVZ00913.1 fimbrial protein [Burkholderia ubonensis]KWE89070.1 fimbrial protein [Burkholderia ubonensis]
MNRFPHSGVGAGYVPRVSLLTSMVLSAIAGWHASASAAPVPSADAGDTRAVATQVASVQFDSGFLTDSGRNVADLSRFEKGNAVMPGMYSVDVYVNDNLVTSAQVTFRASAKSLDAQPCFDEALLQDIGVDVERLHADTLAQLRDERACMELPDAIPDAASVFAFDEQRLRLSIPQSVLRRSPRGYVGPNRWDSGVTMGMLNYNANVYSRRNAGGPTTTQGYVGLTAGVNLGKWHFRHEGSYNWATAGGGKYQDIATYMRRDLAALKAQLTVGESYTTGELFDSTQFRGVQLASDDRMLPESMRGYAPVVRGVANSNAKVTIRQNGVTIYETTVAPGAFEIDDLYATGYGGDLKVTVTEANGSVHQFSVPYAAVPMSLRPGVHRYSFVAGTVRDTQSDRNPLFMQGTWQQGITNLLTGYGGITVAQGYLSAMLGSTFNTPFGAIGMDVTQASTSVPGVRRFNGTSARVSYSKSIPQTQTDVTIAAYRYSTSGYFGLNDAMLVRERVASQGSIDSVARQRSRASLSVNQSLGERGGRLALTVSAQNYWNRGGSDVSYSASYSNTFRNVSYGVSVLRQQNSMGRSETQYYLSATIPLGKTSSTMATTSFSRNSTGQMQALATLSGSALRDDRLSYSVTANRSSGGGSASNDGSGTIVYRGAYGEVSATAGVGTGYQQGSLGIRGGVVAHRGGVTLAQPLSETFAIVKAPDAAGARVLNSPGARVDWRGYAVVPYLTPYSMNAVEIDPEGLSTDVEIKATTQQVAPRAGAVPLLSFQTVSGKSAVIDARRADGSALPFGAAVVDAAGKEIGVVGQGSRIFARGLDDNGTLTVRWSDDAKALCSIRYALPVAKSSARNNAVRRFDAVCAAQ